jgi:hypothetical protein
MNNYSVLDRPPRDFRPPRILDAPKPRPLARPKPERLPRRRGVTIAIHLSGAFSLLTATDTQETYSSGEKVDSGKIISASRLKPLGSINIAGAGDSTYVKAISQELSNKFQNFAGTIAELETEIRETASSFYADHVMPFVGKVEHYNVPNYALLLAVDHEGNEKLWNIEKTMVTDASLYDCIGAGKPAADGLVGRLYPRYPTLDSLAILAAYVIYRVKSTVDGCGLKTEIRFIQHGRFGIGFVPPDRIEAWEALFQKYERLEREIFYHAMNFSVRPAPPPPPVSEAMQKQGIAYDHEKTHPPQMRPMPDIGKEIAEIQAEFAKFPILKPLS